jgi:ribA/ribD-fused uncharacterized protein
MSDNLAPNIIDRFVGDYGFLNNFYPSAFHWNGKLWKTVEHAYQAGKTHNINQINLIHSAPTPNIAKRLGQSIIKRPDWDQYKLSFMEELIELKFNNPFLAHKLLETGDAILIQNNKWGDRFFGVYQGAGMNHLGLILMKVRENLKKERKNNE